MIVQGKNVVVYVQGYPYACAISATVNVGTDTVETSVKGSGIWKTFLPRQNSWTASLTGVVTLEEVEKYSLPELRSMQWSLMPVLMRFEHTDDGGKVYTEEGSAIIISTTDESNVDVLNTFTIELQGNGLLQQVYTTVTPILNGAKVNRYEFTADGGETAIVSSLLANRDIVEVVKDGIGYARIITSGTPVNKEVLWTKETGRLDFAFGFEPGEVAYILYQ